MAVAATLLAVIALALLDIGELEIGVGSGHGNSFGLGGGGGCVGSPLIPNLEWPLDTTKNSNPK